MSKNSDNVSKKLDKNKLDAMMVELVNVILYGDENIVVDISKKYDVDQEKIKSILENDDFKDGVERIKGQFCYTPTISEDAVARIKEYFWSGKEGNLLDDTLVSFCGVMAEHYSKESSPSSSPRSHNLITSLKTPTSGRGSP